MQIPPVGHIRQQVAVVDRVAVQMHTLGLDQQDHIWRAGSNVSGKEERREKKRQRLTVQQVFRKFLKNMFHAQRTSSIQAVKEVLCQFGASFVVSAVNSLKINTTEVFMSGSPGKQRRVEGPDLTEGAEDPVRTGGLGVPEESLNLTQAAAAGRKQQPLGAVVRKEPRAGAQRFGKSRTELLHRTGPTILQPCSSRDGSSSSICSNA